VNLARRQGVAVTTESKYGAGGNTQKGTSLNTAKLDQETEELSHKKVDLNVGKLIAQVLSRHGRTNQICTNAQIRFAQMVCAGPAGQGDVAEGSGDEDLREAPDRDGV
jgi:putative transcription factor